MSFEAAKDQFATLKFQAEQHEVIKDDDLKTRQEYVLHLMHTADYETAASLAIGKTVLDLGCNGGHGTAIIGSLCKEITGVDVSPAAIAAAKLKHESVKITFRLVDGMSLPFPAHAFDLVTTCQVIEHLADYEIHLRKMRRVLRPAGLLLITTPNAAIGQKPWNPFHVHEFRAKELGDLLQGDCEALRILGQFATDNTYAVEYHRCINTRGSVPMACFFVEKVGRRLWRLVTSALGFLDEWLKARARAAQSFQTAHPLKDFYYKESDLNRSLSLVACCSSDSTTVAGVAFLADR